MVAATATCCADAGGGWLAGAPASLLTSDCGAATVEASATLGGCTPPGGVGFTSGGAAMVAATAACTLCAAVAAPSFCPQCWQKANPDGVSLPHEAQVTLPDPPAGSGAETTADEGEGATADDTADGAVLVGSRGADKLVPHILQKFIPSGLTAPHAGQVGPSAICPWALLRGAAGAASSFCPQSWQKIEPSRFAFPQFAQRGIADRPSRVLFQIGFAERAARLHAPALTLRRSPPCEFGPKK
jgi:hypothetical protein